MLLIEKAFTSQPEERKKYFPPVPNIYHIPVFPILKLYDVKKKGLTFLRKFF